MAKNYFQSSSKLGVTKCNSL